MESDNSVPSIQVIKPIDYKRVSEDEFFEDYANNVVLEPTAWDLKLIFGKIDLSKGPNTVVQHAAMTLPWAQIKVGLYFLQVHLAVHEMLNGKIHIPKGVIGPPVPPTEDQEKTVPHAKEAFTIIQGMFKNFSEANPEAF
jgi:hypothetical protein